MEQMRCMPKSTSLPSPSPSIHGMSHGQSSELALPYRIAVLCSWYSDQHASGLRKTNRYLRDFSVPRSCARRSWVIGSIAPIRSEHFRLALKSRHRFYDGVDALPTASMCQSGGVEHHLREASVSKVIIIGLDIAKHVFHAHGADGRGRAMFSKRISRGKLLDFFATQPSCTVAGGMWWSTSLGPSARPAWP